jgi:gliding motility-associated-like protein
VKILLKHSFAFLFLLFSTVVFGQSENCSNGLDDDGDGLIDCFDDECGCTTICQNDYYAECTDTCSVPTSNNPFDLRIKWQFRNEWHNYNTCITGDLDNDGFPEIVGKKGPFFYNSPVRNINNIIIVDGRTGQKKYEINSPAPYYYSTAMTIADADRDGYGEVYFMAANYSPYGSDAGKILCYEFNGTNFSRKWSSDRRPGFSGGSDIAFNVSITDFDGDGLPEIYCGNQIFDALTGRYMAGGSASDNWGEPQALRQDSRSLAVDVLPDNICTDCRGQELIVGNQTFSVYLDRNNFANSRVVVERTFQSKRDGYVSVADMDLDGDLDAVFTSAKSFQGTLEVYDFVTNQLLFPSVNLPANRDWIGHPTLGDIEGDGSMEIILCTPNRFDVYTTRTGSLTLLWTKTTTDQSGRTGSTMFDFNGDGIKEIVYRDETRLYFFDGPTGNELFRGNCTSGTGWEIPVVVDTDNDSHSELLCSCGTDIVAYESNGTPWVSSRPVWNQNNYFNVNVNDDLTIPAVQQQHQLPANNKHLLNGFFNQYSNPQFLLGDVTAQIDSTTCLGQNTTIHFTICNVGANDIVENLPITLFSGNPFLSGNAQVVQSIIYQNFIKKDSCYSLSVTINNLASGDYFLVANAAPNTPLPINLQTNFPLTNIIECSYPNNFDSLNYQQAPVLNFDLGPDQVLCPGESLTLQTNLQNVNLQWNNGSQADSLVISDEGSYWLCAQNVCGSPVCDTIQIELDQTNLTLGPDLDICRGDTLTVTNTNTNINAVNWIINNQVYCQNCAEIEIAPRLSGNIIANGKSIFGCDLNDTIRVSVFPSYMVFDTLAFCSGNSIMFNGQEINTPGDYTFNLTSRLGCDSTIQLHTFWTNDTIIIKKKEFFCQGDSIEINGIYYNNAQIVTNILDDGSCLVIQEIEILESQVYSTYDTLQFCKGETIFYNGIEYDEEQEIRFNYLSSQGCDSTHSTLLQTLDTSFRYSILQICENETADIFGQNESQPGIYQKVFQNFNGCDSTVSIELRVNPIDTSFEQLFICKNDTLDLFNRLITEEGTYNFVEIASTGCDSILKKEITFYPEFSYTASSLNSCFGLNNGSIQIQSNANLIYNWSNNLNDTSHVGGLSPGSYFLTLTDENQCIIQDTFLIEETKQLDFELFTSPPTCPDGTDATITINSPDPEVVFSLDGETFQTSEFTGLSSGNHIIYMQDPNGCTFTENVFIENPSPINIGLATEITITLGDSIRLYPQANFMVNQYFWTPQELLSCSNCPTPYARPFENTLFELIAVDSNQCEARASIFVQVEEEYNVFIPSAFSPNGDGINDKFTIFTSSAIGEILELTIFDRWGNFIWSNSNFPPNDEKYGWDGTFRNKEMDSGVFAYYGRVLALNGHILIVKGDLSLIK